MATTSMTGGYGFLNFMQSTNKPVVKNIYKSYISAGGIVTHVGAIHTEGSMTRRGKRAIDKLPTPHVVPLNGTVQNPGFQPWVDYEEGVCYIRDVQPFDRAFLNDKNAISGNPIAKQIEAYVEARSFLLDNYIINNYKAGGPIADPQGINGIKYRLLYPQAQNGTGSGCNSACRFQSTSDLSDAGIAAAGAWKMARDFQRMLSHMGSKTGKGIVAIASPQFMWQFDMLIKSGGQSGGFTTSTDAFDRTVLKFMDMIIAPCGLLPPQDGGLQTTPVIDDSQDINGFSGPGSTNGMGSGPGDPLYNSTGAVYTSVYFINTAADHFSLWQAHEPWLWQTPVPGQFYNVAQHEQSIGIWQLDTRSIGCIYGIRTNGPLQD